MITQAAHKMALKWMITAFVLTLLVGCSPSNSQSQNPPSQTDSATQTPSSNQSTQPSPSPQTTPSSSTQATNPSQGLLLNMKKLAEQGKVINCDFPAKTSVLEDVKKKWGEPDKIDWVPAAKGNYATYSSHVSVFGFNKGMQIFEVRSFDKQLQLLSLTMTKEVYGTPAYDVKVNGEEIIGYTAGQEFKIELVFPQPTNSNPDPMMDHYLVLYPQGTVNSMANDPGRQW